MSNSKKYRSEDEIEAVVRGFESCATSDADFNHAAHLTVAFSYLLTSGLTVTEATGRMRAGLFHFLDHYGHDRRKYHETITLFWFKLVEGFISTTDRQRPLCDLANELLAAYDDAKLIYSYYSKERLSSEEARRTWIEPDVRPLDFAKVS